MEKIRFLAAPLLVLLLIFSLSSFPAVYATDRSEGEGGKFAIVVQGTNEEWAKNDADAMEKDLKSKGYEVVRLNNPTREELNQALDDMDEKVGDNDTFDFYYTGHGNENGFRINEKRDEEGNVTSKDFYSWEDLDKHLPKKEKIMKLLLMLVILVV